MIKKNSRILVYSLYAEVLFLFTGWNMSMCCFLEWGNTEFKLGSPAHLFINVNVPSEVRSEVLDLCADVFLHHGDQRDPELFQLGLQRGQLRGLLPKERRR